MLSTDQSSAVLEINLDALAQNYNLLTNLVQPTDCAATLKADAYGLGAIKLGKCLMKAGCKTFFVAHLDEGIDLRGALPKSQIFVLHGNPPGACGELHKHNLIPVLNTKEQLKHWILESRGKQNHPIGLHVDTGMNRLGLQKSDLEKFICEFESASTNRIILLMSHLACADQPENPMNAEQRLVFDSLTERIPNAIASLANSSGIFLGPNYHYHLVRSGAALYGLNPTPTQENPMHQLIRLRAPILQLEKIDRCKTVGYGASHRLKSARVIATIPVGYADGFPWSLGDKGLAMIAGMAAPIVGRISMDLITLDVTNIPEKHTTPGQLVELIGQDVPLDLVAEMAGTIGYEILTSLGSRYRRQYLSDVDPNE